MTTTKQKQFEIIIFGYLLMTIAGLFIFIFASFQFTIIKYLYAHPYLFALSISTLTIFVYSLFRYVIGVDYL